MAADTRQITGIILAIIIATGVGFAGLAVNQELSQATEAEEDQNVAASLSGTQFVYVPPGSGFGKDQTVRDSRGKSLQFTGTSDSYLTSDSEVNLASNNNNWTLSQGVWINSSSTGKNMTVIAVGDPNLVLEYRGNQTQNKWVAWYYDHSDSYEIAINATDPENASVVFVERSGNTLTIYRNTTEGENTTIGTDSTVQGNLTNSNLHGRLDETRFWSTDLNASQRQQVVDDPVLPLADNRTLRIMYDQLGGTNVPFYWAATSGTASNATWSTGFSGDVLNESGFLVSNPDYEWQETGPKIKPTSGGRIAEAPVAFVEYTYSIGTDRIDNAIETGYGLADVAMLVLMFSAVLTALFALRDQ